MALNIIRAGDLQGAHLFELRNMLLAKAQELEKTSSARIPEAEVRARVRSELEHELARVNGGWWIERFSIPGDRGRLDALGWFEAMLLIGEKRVEDALVARAMKHNADIGLPSAERAERIAGLKSDLWKLSLEEERETLRLEALGLTVLRRPDADIKAIAEVWREMDTQERKAAVAAKRPVPSGALNHDDAT